MRTVLALLMLTLLAAGCSKASGQEGGRHGEITDNGPIAPAEKK